MAVSMPPGSRRDSRMGSPLNGSLTQHRPSPPLKPVLRQLPPAPPPRAEEPEPELPPTEETGLLRGRAASGGGGEPRPADIPRKRSTIARIPLGPPASPPLAASASLQRKARHSNGLVSLPASFAFLEPGVELGEPAGAVQRERGRGCGAECGEAHGDHSESTQSLRSVASLLCHSLNSPSSGFPDGAITLFTSSHPQLLAELMRFPAFLRT